MKAWSIVRWALVISLSCLLLFCGVFLWLAQIEDKPTQASILIEEGNQAPGFTLKTIRGDSLSLAQYRGHPVMINFWATWCGPCKDEMPYLQAAYEQYAAQGFVILAVHHKGTLSEVAKYGENNDLTFPLLVDLDGAVNDLYGIHAFPTTFFIDRSGQVQKIKIGALEEADLETLIQTIFTPIIPTRTPLPTEEIIPTRTPTLTVVPPLVLEGCVTDTVINARNGPGRSYLVISGIPYNQCLGFDARSADSKWLRLAEGAAPNGARLWASFQYIELKGDIQSLPVAP